MIALKTSTSGCPGCKAGTGNLRDSPAPISGQQTAGNPRCSDSSSHCWQIAWKQSAQICCQPPQHSPLSLHADVCLSLLSRRYWPHPGINPGRAACLPITPATVDLGPRGTAGHRGASLQHCRPIWWNERSQLKSTPMDLQLQRIQVGCGLTPSFPGTLGGATQLEQHSLASPRPQPRKLKSAPHVFTSLTVLSCAWHRCHRREVESMQHGRLRHRHVLYLSNRPPELQGCCRLTIIHQSPDMCFKVFSSSRMKNRVQGMDQKPRH